MPLINIAIFSIALMALFLPFFSLEIFSVYMYDLSRTQISKKGINYFELLFGNYYFAGKLPMVLFFVIILLLIIINFVLYKSENKKVSFFITTISMLLTMAGVIFFSSSNTIFAKMVGGKTYMYQSDFIQIANKIQPIEPEGPSYNVAYWINEGIGCYLIITLLSISFFITFYCTFLRSNTFSKD